MRIIAPQLFICYTTIAQPGDRERGGDVMEIGTGTEYPTKLFAAVGEHTQALLLSFDGVAIGYELEETDNDLLDWNVEKPEDAGLWVWEGYVCYPPDDDQGDDYAAEFKGAWRRATAEEATRFAAGERVFS